MNKLLITIVAAVALMTTAFSQVGIRSANWKPKNDGFQTRSIGYEFNSNSVGFLWLRDGLSDDHVAITYPLAQVSGLGSKVEIVALGSFRLNGGDNNDRIQAYLGTGLSVKVFENNGFQVKVFGGYKGLDLSSGRFTSTNNGFVYGVGITIPIK